MGCGDEDSKKLVVRLIIIALSIGFIVIMILIWNVSHAKNKAIIDSSTTEMIETMEKELEENKDIYENITKDIDSTILISAEKGLNKVKEDNNNSSEDEDSVEDGDSVEDSALPN